MQKIAAVFLLTMLAWTACNQNTGPLPKSEHPESAFIVELSTVASVTGATLPKRAFLFYGARPANGGPPIYVARRENPTFPGIYYLTEDNRMGLSGGDGGPLVVFARLDADGDAGTIGPDDWAGEASVPAVPGNATVGVVLAPLALAEKPTGPAMKIEIDITGPAAAGVAAQAGAVTYVLLREQGGRMPLAALKADLKQFPAVVTLEEHHILTDQLPPLSALEIVVKVDQDGNPQTTVKGDYVGVAPAAKRTTIVLQPDDRAAE